jgi:hypothetical protein
MKQVFVSYSHKDKTFATRLVADLRKGDVQVWCDDHKLKIGDSIVDQVSHGIQAADYLITILSPDAVTSPWAQEELRQAESLRLSGASRVRILPVLYRDCEMPSFLVGILYADFRDHNSYTESFARLLDAVGGTEKESFHSNELAFMRALRLPRFYDGQYLTAISLLRFQIAINAIEASLSLKTTAFQPFTHGQTLEADHLNDLTPPVDAVRAILGLPTKFFHFPFRREQVLKPEQLNELVDRLNEVIDRVISRDQHNKATV